MLTIDADAHVLENPHTWDFLEESEQDFRPEIVVSERQYTKAELRDKWDRMPKRGAEYWFVDGRLQPKNHNVGLDTTPEAREMRDVEARLRHMDELEVDVQVLYPTLFLRPVTMKPAVELALCRTYNRWLAGLCEGTKGRLRWIALLPFLTMDKALVELAWARDAGACGFMMRGLEGDKQLTDPYFFPLYAEAARLNLPACVHSGIASFTYQDMFPATAGFRRFKLAVVGDFHSLIMEGIPARFPGLKFGFIEVSAQWLPYVIHDLKRLSERQGVGVSGRHPAGKPCVRGLSDGRRPRHHPSLRRRGQPRYRHGLRPRGPLGRDRGPARVKRQGRGGAAHHRQDPRAERQEPVQPVVRHRR